MRWIDRGPEPSGIRRYDRRFTQRWIQHYRDGVGERPRDSHWRQFREMLGGLSGNVCWYCERLCFRDVDDKGKAPTVDHFKPLRHYPELAYRWFNWVFSCHRCNGDYKRDKWPALGYVDPSVASEQDGPEQYFDYDAQTGEIIPRSGLPREAREKALQTIDDLGLNSRDVLNYRLDWTRRFTRDWKALPAGDRGQFVECFTQMGVEFAGTTLMVVQQLLVSGE